MVEQLRRNKVNGMGIERHFVYFLVVACAICIVFGCRRRSDTAQTIDTQIIAEGVIYRLEYKLEDGRTGGFTRINHNKAVPGLNGSWNIDAYGRLTRDYLIITRPQIKELGPRVIPSHRLLDVQFGDGGIKNVDENNPAPAV